MLRLSSVIFSSTHNAHSGLPPSQPLKPDLSVTCAKINEGAGVEHARKETIPTTPMLKLLHKCLGLGVYTLDISGFENISDAVFVFGKLHSWFQTYQRFLI